MILAPQNRIPGMPLWRRGRATAGGGGGITFIGATGTDMVTGGTETISLPGSFASGDFVIVVAGNDSDDHSVNTSGYTDILTSGSPDVDHHILISYKIISTDTDVVINRGSTKKGAVLVQVWRGVNSSTPIDVTTTTDLAETGMPNSPSITPTTSGAYVLSAGWIDDDDVASGVSAPSGYSNLTAQDTAQSSTVDGSTVMLASKAWTSGAEDPAAFGGSGNDRWKAASIALRPA